MELKIIAKQRKLPRFYNDHKFLARALEGIKGIKEVIYPERIPNRKGTYIISVISGNFNVSDVYQEITSRGYSILKAHLTTEDEISTDSRLKQWTMEVKQVVDKIKQQRYKTK